MRNSRLVAKLLQYKSLFIHEFAMWLVVWEFRACLQNSSSALLCSAAVMLQFFAQRWEQSVASLIVVSSRHYASPMMLLAQPGVRPNGSLEFIQDGME